MKKERIDKLLVDLGLVETRSRAQALIMAGDVIVDDHAIKKAGDLVSPDATIRLRGEALPFVSRGGLKLQHALDHFAIEVRDRLALDVGASTGGFTDCLLQRGAAKVCAVDVGHNQLAWKLRNDARVVVIEGYNARNLRAEDLPFAPAIVTCDVSFISQTLILPRIKAVAAPGAIVVTLVKPQFEVGKDDVGKGGVVRDPAKRQGAIDRCVAVAVELGAVVRGVIPSPILGPAGNVEFLLVADLA